MPLAAVVPAVIGAGATIYASSQDRKAASSAQAAQDRAAQQQLAAQQANFDRITNLNQPYITGGNAAFDALLRQIVPGYAQAAPAAAPAQPYGGTANQTNMSNPAYFSPGGSGGYTASPTLQAAVTAGPQGPAMSGGPDYAAYFRANPDLQAEYQRLESGKGADMFDSPEAYAAWHYQNFGQNEGRQLPTVAAQPTQPQTPAPTTPAQPQPGTDLLTADRPDAPAAPTFERPEAMQAPDLQSYLSNFQADPGYQFRLKEGLGAINAASAVRGKLRSGDAAKALMARSSDLASQEYNNWFARQMAQFQAANGQYQYGQNRADNVFADDRGYDTARWQFDTQRQDQNFNTDRGFQANRYDTQTGNLFNIANIGLGAAGNVSGAGTNFANAQSNIFGSQANAAADAANARAAANAQMVGGLAGAAANLFNNWGGGARSTPTSNLGSVNWSGVSNPFAGNRVSF